MYDLSMTAPVHIRARPLRMCRDGVPDLLIETTSRETLSRPPQNDKAYLLFDTMAIGGLE